MTAALCGWNYPNGCRCDQCRRTKRNEIARGRARRYAERQLVDGRLVAPVDPARHGKLHTYQRHGCRCVPCTSANRDYMRGYVARRYAS